jgi:hypothetical protein
MSNESPDTPRRNRPLIWGGIILGFLLLSTVIGLVAMYVADFNLLDWME